MRYTPYWLSTLTPELKTEVQDWIEAKGITLVGCAGFDIEGDQVIFHTYVKNQADQFIATPDGEPVMEVQRRWAAKLPLALR